MQKGFCYRECYKSQGIFTSSFFIVPYSLQAQRSDDAWGTMKNIQPELWSSKGPVNGSSDLGQNDYTFEVYLDSNSNTSELSIDIANTGKDNSILEYSVFCDTRPAGVYIDDGYGQINVDQTDKVKVKIYGDYFSEGDHKFKVIVNSNDNSNEYNVIVHKGVGFTYQEIFEEKEPIAVMKKPQFLTRYTYTGREYNCEVDQYYYRARTYVSGLGRFTGKDPVGYSGYEYVKNNPMGYNDPTGRSVIENQKKKISEQLDVVVQTYGIDVAMDYYEGQIDKVKECRKKAKEFCESYISEQAKETFSLTTASMDVGMAIGTTSGGLIGIVAGGGPQSPAGVALGLGLAAIGAVVGRRAGYEYAKRICIGMKENECLSSQ